MVLTLVSIPIATQAEHYYGKKDDSRIVIDEFVGYAWAGAWWMTSVPALIAAFILFRIFDVSKPLGIRKLEALPAGWGCVIDDVASGIAAALIIGASLFTQQALVDDIGRLFLGALVIVGLAAAHRRVAEGKLGPAAAVEKLGSTL